MKRVKINNLEKGQDVTLFLKSGELIRGIFQFIDGDEYDDDSNVVLKPLNPDSSNMLGWKIKHIHKAIIN